MSKALELGGVWFVSDRFWDDGFSVETSSLRTLADKVEF